MCRLRDTVSRIAQARRTTLITGATGTGKEVLARTLHALGRVASQPFVPVHCGALPEQLAEAELFGHTRGAFTGAVQARTGLIRSARGGTLFLDEIDSLTLPMQAKLLRFLEASEVRAVGSDEVTRCGDTWVLAATNKDLHARVMDGTFRDDLLYRLEVIHVRLPELREREDDIELLAEHFLGDTGRRGLVLSPCARRALRAHRWPGNVRELKHRIERAALLVQGTQIEPSDLGLGGIGPLATRLDENLDEQLWGLVDREGLSLAEAVALCERKLIERALSEEGENRTRAAHRLGIHVRTIFKKLAHVI